MSAWTKEELDKIGAAEELEIMSQRADGTLRKAVPIWVVRVGGDLFIRAYKGPEGPWFRAALERRAGRVRSGGVEKDVTYALDISGALNDQIDAAYIAKYGHYEAEYIDPMVAAPARAATIRLVPAGKDA